MWQLSPGKRYVAPHRSYPGTITALNEDGTLDVLYDDGQSDTRVLPKYVHAYKEPTLGELRDSNRAKHVEAEAKARRASAAAQRKMAAVGDKPAAAAAAGAAAAAARTRSRSEKDRQRLSECC